MRARIIELNQIREIVKHIDPVQPVEDGFVAYSLGKVVVPPVGEMLFEKPPGDVHIKYGYIRDDDYYVIKIASSFYDNVKIGLSSNNGLMLIFDQETGELESILLDEGYLTDVRTAAAGAIAARYLAPKRVYRIGVFGAGTQGTMQLHYLKSIVNCTDVIVWGRSSEKLEEYKHNMGSHGFNVETTSNTSDVTSSCNLIITATPSKDPLINANQIQKGTHITAIGSDTPEKNELDPVILSKADIVVTDSVSQCLTRGEIYQAVKARKLNATNVVELGNVIVGKELQRSSDDQITIADFTGVAIQDIQITKVVYEALNSKEYVIPHT